MKRCLVRDRLTGAAAEYLLDSPALREILTEYADPKLTRHGDPASYRVTFAIRVATGEETRDRQLCMGEAKFLYRCAEHNREWTIRAIRAIPAKPPTAPVEVERAGDRFHLSLPSDLAAQIPDGTRFRIEVSREGVFYRRMH